MSDMLSAFRDQATARLAELDKAIQTNDRALVDAQEARRTLRAEHEDLTRALAGSVKRTYRKNTVVAVDEL